MRRHLVAAAALCVLALAAGPMLAQDEAAGGDRRKGEKARKGGREPTPGAERVRERYEQLLTELKLTEKQNAPVRQILETYRTDMANWMKQNGPALRELAEAAAQARRDGKADEARASLDKMQALNQELGQKTQNVLAQLKEHLTEEQMATVRRLLVLRFGQARSPLSLALLQRLDLDEKQQAKVKEIVDAAREAGKDKEPPARYEAMRKAWDKIVSDVLTPQQREKLKTLQEAPARPGVGGMFAGLELTGEQREKIAKIMEEARRQAREAGEPDARRRIYADAQEKIADEVLTPQQREKLQQLRKEARERLQRERGQAPRAKDQPKAGSKTEPVIVD